MELKNESHTILHASERCAEVFKEVPLVSYRRARNLCDMLVTEISDSPVTYIHLHTHLQRLCLPEITKIAKTAQATSEIKPDSPTKAPHPAPTSVSRMWPRTQQSEGSQNPSNIQAPTKTKHTNLPWILALPL